MRSWLLGILLVLIITFGGLFFGYAQNHQSSSVSLTTPLSVDSMESVAPTPISTPTPIIFQFDGSTNLQQQLNLVNPEVLDSDFTDLSILIKQL